MSKRPAGTGTIRTALVALGAVAAAALAPGAAHAAGPAVQLSAVPAKKAGTLVTFKGKAGTRTSGRVSVQRRSGRRWTTVASGRTAKGGRYALTWAAPTRRGNVTVRARLAGSKPRVSKTRRVRILAAAKGAKKVTVSPKTRILSASTVASVPAPGQPGKLTYSGGNDAQVGQFLVIGQGANTPNGFLGRVTDVDRAGGNTVVSTVPASLRQAVPDGSFDIAAKKVTATDAKGTSRRGRLRRATITCTGSAGASITHDVSFSAGLNFSSSWTLLGGLQSASLTADASLKASVQAALGASGSCALAPQALLTVKGPGFSGFVGPVPIVLTSSLTVFLDASASVQGSITAGANAGFSASAGVGYTKAGGFKPISKFEPSFSFDPPALSASANVRAGVTPTVDVLLYGLAGPRVALKTGVSFDADIAKDPWWTLSVPVAVTASLTVKPLNLVSPELTVYEGNFPLTDSGGPFRAPGSPPPPPLPPVVNRPNDSGRLATGSGHSCALPASGTPKCWGANNKGQLGTGSTTPTRTAVPVTNLTDATQMAADLDHTCALRVSGAIRCWGANDSGELGDGTTTNRVTPTDVRTITNATAVDAGYSHSCAVLQTGRVNCWGSNAQRQLGNGNTTSTTQPVAVDPTVSGAKAVTAGANFSCALLGDGTVKCWGDNGSGQLGDGTTTNRTAPVAVRGVTNAVAIGSGAGLACAVLATGGVTCWGADASGQLGDGRNDSSPGPVTVSGVTNAVSVSGSEASMCAVTATGQAKCWGKNDRGQLGDGSTSGRGTAADVSGLGDATAISGGSLHTCGLRASGAVACWGWNADGELGDNTTTDRSTPVTVIGYP